MRHAIDTDQRFRLTWVMPPQRGMWIPVGVVHGVRMLGVVSTESIYVEPAAAHGIPDRCQVVGISPFLRSLIAQALDIPPEYARTVTPAHPCLAGRCRRFLLRPSVHETIEQRMKPVGLSRCAFTRLFRGETGLSFVEWRQQACVMAALPRLVAIARSMATRRSRAAVALAALDCHAARAARNDGKGQGKGRLV